MPDTDWNNASGPLNYNLLLRGGFKTPVKGVQSKTQIDITWYDNEVYRDEIFAAEMGTGRTLQINKTGGGGLVVTNGEQTLFNGTAGTDTYTFATPSDPHLDKSDSITHTPPRFTQKTRTLFLWWSGPSGTGNVVAEAWADQVISMAPETYTRF
jgi:hypothetical protein